MPSGHEPERINRVLALIDARFAEPLRLGELSAAASLSERSLNRWFVQHLGESVGRYVTRVRIGHAARMLADTSLPVSVIALRSGFPNVSHFNRQFKSMKGTTPASWRSQFASGKTAAAATVDLTERSPSLQRRKSRPGATKRA
jgi:transcriptional regulator GlxA family with amidase domain